MGNYNQLCAFKLSLLAIFKRCFKSMKSIKDIDVLFAEWQSSITDYLPRVLLSIVVVFLFYFIARILKKYSLKFYSKFFKKTSDVAKWISVSVYFFLLLSGVFLALEILGLESVLSKLLAGAGIIGIVAGFAFKDIASNAFAGMLLNLQRPFKEGDWVEINSHYGTIEEISWITTSIKTISGQEVFIPNQLIYNTTFTNFSSFNKRRVVMKSGVSYGDDLDHVKRVSLEEVKKIDLLLKDEVVDFYYTSIGSSTYNFEIRFWINFIDQQDYMNAMSETIVRIKKRFEEENISIAYSVTTLDFGVKGGVNIFDKSLQMTSKE